MRSRLPWWRRRISTARPRRRSAAISVDVNSIIANPNLDPHDYEATPSTARAVADARIVIYNGADYDPWMDKLIAATDRPQRIVINVANLLGRKPGDNPHLWYDPAAMPSGGASGGEGAGVGRPRAGR